MSIFYWCLFQFIWRSRELLKKSRHFKLKVYSYIVRNYSGSEECMKAFTTRWGKVSLIAVWISSTWEEMHPTKLASGFTIIPLNQQCNSVNTNLPIICTPYMLKLFHTISALWMLGSWWLWRITQPWLIWEDNRFCLQFFIALFILKKELSHVQSCWGSAGMTLYSSTIEEAILSQVWEGRVH